MDPCPTCAAVQAVERSSRILYQSRAKDPDGTLHVRANDQLLWTGLPSLPYEDARDATDRPAWRFSDASHYLWVPAPARAVAEGRADPTDPIDVRSLALPRNGQLYTALRRHP
ncbi:MAG TPA: hypothetical protein VJB16_06760, partial [archaeon]|nr:hypothetical protein [archaeon]